LTVSVTVLNSFQARIFMYFNGDLSQLIIEWE
jgi:hypothetical protein